MRPVGVILVVGAAAVPLFWFVPLMGKHDGLAVLSQYLAAAGLITMGLSQMLATRWRWLETVFGGLDRIYVLHKWMGISALGAVLLHDTVDADIRSLERETLLVGAAETFGEFALYGFLVLAIVSIATFVPYQFWRLTHKFMGAVFALGTLHFVFMPKPFDLGDPLGLYVLGFCGLGLVCYGWTLVPDGRLRVRRRYQVTAVEDAGDAVAISLAPVGRGIRHRAGQFAFVRFDVPGLDETHPFTISRAPDKTRGLRFTVKALGDFTVNLKGALKVGATARVSPAYGHFQRRDKGPEIWLAAGIGVTPFVAWAEALAADGGPVHLFYCVRNRARAAHLVELEALAAAKPGLHLHVVESGTRGRLTAAEIAAAVGEPLGKIRVAFCGPKAMREGLRQDLQALGLPAGRFVYEEFEIRSGVGLRKGLAWVVQLAAKRWPALAGA